MAEAVKAIGHGVKKKAADELSSIEGHRPWPTAMAIVTPTERHLVICHADHARLLDVMMADAPNVSTADTALGQLRDCYEILIKFTAVALMQALVDAGDDNGRWSKESLYTQISLGDWAGLMRAASTEVGASDSLGETLRRLAVATLKHLVRVQMHSRKSGWSAPPRRRILPLPCR